MKTILRSMRGAMVLLLVSILGFGQAPDLGTASFYAMFTAVGAFSNDGATHVTGDIGTNVGAFTGFPPGIVDGQIHVADPASVQAATDVDLAYTFLSELTCGEVIGTTLGNGQILTPNIYCLGAASTLNEELILDGEGDPDALFIFKIDGALSTSTFSTVTLINSASLCNVYWQINGAFELGDSSIFRGTIVANGAISLLESATLYGRGLSRAGAISMHNNLVALGIYPVATIAAGGSTSFCLGDSVTLSATPTGAAGTVSYLWSPGGLTDSMITVSPDATTFYTVEITADNACSVGTDTITVTIVPCACPCTAPVILSIDSICGAVASMCWSSEACATSYLVRWNVLPNTTWIYASIDAPDTCRTFRNQYGKVNELQVASVCENGDTSDYSPVVTWVNYLACPAPENLAASNITAVSADLSWNAVPDANKYVVLYKVGATKLPVTVNGTALTLTDLPPATTVQWKVKSRCEYCDENAWGAFTPFQSFTTAPQREWMLNQPMTGGMNLFPNPAQGNFALELNTGLAGSQPYFFTLQNWTGRVLIAEEGSLAEGLLLKEVVIPKGIVSGMYRVSIYTGGKLFTEHLVVNGD